jgi:hypothetical protein
VGALADVSVVALTGLDAQVTVGGDTAASAGCAAWSLTGLDTAAGVSPTAGPAAWVVGGLDPATALAIAAEAAAWAAVADDAAVPVTVGVGMLTADAEPTTTVTAGAAPTTAMATSSSRTGGPGQ